MSRTNRFSVAGLVLAAGLAFSAHAQPTLFNEIWELPNGESVRVSKTMDPTDSSNDSHEFELRGRRYTPEALRTYDAANPPPLIDPRLDAAIANGTLGIDDHIIAYPQLVVNANAIVQSIRAQHQPALQQIHLQAIAIMQLAFPVWSQSPADERAMCAELDLPFAALTQENIDELNRLNLDAEAIGAVMHTQIQTSLANASAAALADLRVAAAQSGAQVVGELQASGAVVIQADAMQVVQLAASGLVSKLTYIPAGEATLDVQKASLGLLSANGPWEHGVTGWPWDAAVIDTGVQQNHPALSSHTFESTYGNNDFIHPNVSERGHGTNVAGVIASTDNTFRGVSYGCDRILVGHAGQIGDHADWLVSGTIDDPEVANLSFEYGIADDADWGEMERFLDAQMDVFQFPWVIAAGNENTGTTTITIPSNTYNGITVGNMIDLNTVTRSDDYRATSTSRGPTLAGRKKPDLMAPGSGSMTTMHTWATGNDFDQFGGTSAAAPHVAGGVLLLCSARGSDDGLPIKATLINTADTWTDNDTETSADDGEVGGSEWNKVYGWGYLDLWEAFYHANDTFVDTINNALPDHKFYAGYMYADEKATLTWNRHVGWNGNVSPGNVEWFTDLDLIAYDRLDGSFLDSSASFINNVEQIAVDDDGFVVLKVNLFNTVDPDVGNEKFALATEEFFVEASPPSLDLSNSISAISPAQHFVVTVTVTNNGGLPAHNCMVDIGLSGGYTVVGDSTMNAGTVPNGGSVEVEFLVDAPCILGGVNSLLSDVSSFSYGEQYTAAEHTFFFPNEIQELDDNVPFAADDPQRFYSFQVVNNEWHAIGVDPGDADRDLQASTGTCPAFPYATSALGGTTRDFIMVNGHSASTGTNYVRVYDGEAGDPYHVEYDRGFDIGLATYSHSISAFEVVEPYESTLLAGLRYRFSVDQTAGACDFAIFQFDPSQEYTRRSGAVRTADETGAAGDEELGFVASEAGVHAFVLVNENHNAAIYDVTLERFCACDYDMNGGISVLDMLAFLADWFAQDGMVVEPGTGADYNASGTVDILDFLDFLGCWFVASPIGVCV